MKIIPSFPGLAPSPDSTADTSAPQPKEGTREAFSEYLQAFDAAGKARVKADFAQKAEGFDPIAWMLRVRHLGLYDQARHDLMAEKNLDHSDLEKMSEEDRIIFESQVYDRVRDKLVERMGRHHHCHCDEEEIRLYRAAPFLISN
ncbi:hypothetical protein ACFO5Q_13955 [Kordiimonas lipolytica]|uniref:Uncharacterized protein n=1 Tax=Kordiimonas lipolytica TaxID=1662421 RepID=A0ABV8UCK9_9PROT|nr:hypothetical protein [Kordiimonas lipolytica]